MPGAQPSTRNRQPGSAAVAVAVVSWNLRELLAATLRSLEPEHRAGRVEVWVVDNASDDGSPELVREQFPWVSLIASSENLGYGGAVNLVAERTATPWIAPANQDIEVRPGAIERLLQAGEREPSAGVIAPRLRLPDGSTQHSVHSFPTMPLTLVFNTGLHRLSPRLGDRLCIEGSWNADTPREVPWSMATFMIVRRSAWDEVGGFDQSQWMHAEDLDLAWRLSRSGWKTRYEPSAEVLHVGSAASKKAFGEELIPRFMAASYAWMARRRSVPFARAVALANAGGAAARFAAYALLALMRPARYRAARDHYRYWLGVHSVGLKPRAELLRKR
jgi:N-acetylglucosaminyl-diphospho-decaprenol L-rhamnosyltransferase